MECKSVFFIVLTVILSLLLILFIVLWVLELGKCNSAKTKILKQNETIKQLNQRVVYMSEKSSNEKTKSLIDKIQKLETQKPELKTFVFGVADQFQIICNDSQTVVINSMYSKVVDNITGVVENEIDITNYIPAFSMLNNKQIINYNTRSIVDNLKITIPYSLPTDEVVKTRVIYGSYSCKSI